ALTTLENGAAAKKKKSKRRQRSQQNVSSQQAAAKYGPILQGVFVEGQQPGRGRLVGGNKSDLTAVAEPATEAQYVETLETSPLQPQSPDVVFSNPAPITINDGVTPPTPSSPYPSNITVSGLAGNISKLTLTLTGLSHTFPDDIDMLLVAPNGANLHFFSDSCGSSAISGLNITMDDAAATLLPDAGPCSSTSYRPGNPSAGDTFPAPAPAGPYNEPTTVGTATF